MNDPKLLLKFRNAMLGHGNAKGEGMPRRISPISVPVVLCILGISIASCSAPSDPTVTLKISGFSPQAITIGQGQGSTETFYIVNRTSSTEILCTLANSRCLANPDWTDGNGNPIGEYLRILPGKTVSLTYPNVEVYGIATTANLAQRLQITETFNGGGEGG